MDSTDVYRLNDSETTLRNSIMDSAARGTTSEKTVVFVSSSLYSKEPR